MAQADGVQPGVRIDRETWDSFRAYVAETYGVVRGNLKTELEAALDDRMDASYGGDIYDRLDRIEAAIEDLPGASSGGDGGSERGSISKTTEDRISDIMEDIRDRADDLDSPRVREEDVEAAIERNAGTSYKTLQRYKKLLQNQRELFAHPSIEDVYFVRSAPFIACVEQGGDGKLRPTEAAEIRGAYGEAWWVENAPTGMLDGEGRGFQ